MTTLDQDRMIRKLFIAAAYDDSPEALALNSTIRCIALQLLTGKSNFDSDFDRQYWPALLRQKYDEFWAVWSDVADR